MDSLCIHPSTLPLSKALDDAQIRNPWFIQSEQDPQAFLADLPRLGFAIVGTREPQRRSLEFLESILSGLKHSRLIIVSGFARGIDRCAHELAVKYGLRTLAILGCGIDVEYPRENASLRKKILNSGGMILSPFKVEAPPLPRNFYERNGLIAGLSKAVWVVEAAEVSGTLNTANWASRLNRQLYATPSFPGDHFYQGNEKLLSQKSPDRFPVAESFFGVHSLGSAWPELETLRAPQLSLKLDKTAPSELQRWVLELASEFGECRIQALMDHAWRHGKSPGQFYLEFEAETSGGLLRHDEDGRVFVSH